MRLADGPMHIVSGMADVFVHNTGNEKVLVMTLYSIFSVHLQRQKARLINVVR